MPNPLLTAFINVLAHANKADTHIKYLMMNKRIVLCIRTHLIKASNIERVKKINYRIELRYPFNL